ncbi:hypothetical protein MGH68_16625 [Erysipelothrix sp. D19-032]
MRAENRDVLDKLVQRVKQVAKGAALMTETTVSIETDARCLDYNANEPLSKLLESVMHEAGAVHLDDHDLKHLSWYAITPSMLSSIQPYAPEHMDLKTLYQQT